LKRYLFAALLLAGCLSILSCGSKSPAAPTITIPTGNPNGPMINAGITRQTIVLSGTPTSNSACQVVLTTAQATPIAATGVTLVAPGPVYIPLTAGSTGYYSDTGSGWTYQPGQTYTIQVGISGTLYTGSIVLPGNVTIPPFTAPGPIVWSYPGNEDVVTVMEQFSPYTSHTVGPVATSGSVSTASSTYFPSTGSYSIQVNVIKTAIGCFGANAYPSALITGTDQYGGTYTK